MDDLRLETKSLGGRLGWAIKRQAPEGRSRGMGLLIARLKERNVLGASYPSVRSYVDKGVDPPLAFIKAAADVLGLREAWLAFGTGAPTDEEESARLARERLEDEESAYARIRSAVPELAALAEFDAAPLDLLVSYVVRLRATLLDTDNYAPDDLESLAREAWDTVRRPVLRWESLVERPLDPRAFTDYTVAMMHALSLSLQLADPRGGSVEG